MVDTDHPLAARILELIPINGLDPELQQEVLAKGEVLAIKRRKTLFEVGARDAYTFYLLDGKLELESDSGAPVPMRAGDDNARRALAQLQPRRYTARARTAVQVFRIERAMLDYILSDEQVLERDAEMQVEELDTPEEEVDWMSRLLSSALFARLPPDNIQKFFAELEPMEVAAGDLIVEQGTEGDFLYIIAEGQCLVTRRAPRTGQDVTLATLRDGDSFGEEALISKLPRNASVSMASDGFLMRLSKRSFEELVSKPTLKPVPWSEACILVAQGARWLDVRFVDEHLANAISESLNVPLNVLRLEIASLDRSCTYVLYCDSGARSSTGAFLLARDGFDAYYLAGGLDHIPEGEDVPMVSRAAGQATPEPAAAMEPPVADAPPPAAEPAAPEPVAATLEPAEQQALAEARPSRHEASAEASAELEELAHHVAAIKAERDRVASFARQAADTAKELKRRYDELYRAAQQERTARLAVEKDLSTFKAEAERRSTMEEARLKGELDRLLARMREAETEHKAAAEAHRTERERLEQEIAGQREERTKAESELKRQEAARLAQQVEFDNATKSTAAELDAERTKTASAQEQVAQLRNELEDLRRMRDEQVRSREDIEQEFEQRLDSERRSLDQERKQLEQARAQLQADGDALADERVRLEQATREQLRDAQLSAEELARRASALDEREIAIDDHRSAVEVKLAQRSEALAAEDARLSEDKLAWRTQIDEAIEAERRRLEGAYETYRRELTEQARKDVAALLEQREAEVCAEYESRMANQETTSRAELDAITAQTEQRMRLERGSFEDRMAALTRVYDLRLAEQAAMLQDEQRQLATGAVRLREALNETERLKQEVRNAERVPVVARAMAAATAPTPAQTQARAQATRGSVPERSAAAAPPPPAPSHAEVPVLDVDLMVRQTTGAASDERARVLSSEQIAAIRRKMQEKLNASRRGT